MESSIDEGQPLHRSHRRYSDGVDNAETTAYPLCNRLFCTETEWDTVEVGKPRRGFWGDWPGPWMARENSCESDYQYSKYIAELYCTGACIFILAIGIVGYILSRKNSAPSSVLYLNTIAVGAMGILAHATQTRVWEALELLTLEHFCVLFAITSCTVAWDLQKESLKISDAIKMSGLQVLLLSPSLLSGNRILEYGVAASALASQISLTKIWLANKSVRNRFPRFLLLVGQGTAVICWVIDILEMSRGCDWEVEMDYNGNFLHDPNIHNHLHAISLGAMGCAMHLGTVFLDFAYFSFKDTPIRLAWTLGIPHVVHDNVSAVKSSV